MTVKDISYDMAKHLANSGFGTLGTDIFINQIPAETNGLMVALGGGTLNKYVPIEETILDIYAKNISSETALSTLRGLIKHLHRHHDITTSTNFVYTVLVIGNIQPVQIDQEYAKVYKITLQVLHRDTGVIS